MTNDKDQSSPHPKTSSTPPTEPMTTETPPPSESSQDEKHDGFWTSLKSVLTYRSYFVYLVTSWILGIFGVIIDMYIMLYLRDFFLFNLPSVELVYVLVGITISIFMGVQLFTRFVGGYVGDNYNRKWLSVLTMLFSGVAMFGFAFATTIPGLFTAALILAGTAIFASGSTSYIYENIEPKHSGLAMGIFQTSAGFGLIGLGLVNVFLGVGIPFLATIQILFFIGGICYVAAAIVRAVFLAPPIPIKRENQDTNKFREFFSQNKNAFRLLLLILPIFMGVLIIDAISDGFYRFVSMYYLNEFLAFSYSEITLMLIVVLAFSIPLSVTVGGFFDRRGSRRAIFIVYSVMPLTLVLLLIAPIVPYWLPFNIVTAIATTLPFLEPLMSTAFVALAMKQINDILWWTLILTYLRKAIPRSETAKMLSIFFIVVMFANLITPIPAGVVYTIYGPFPLLYVALALNLIILLILLFGNIEPKPIPDEYKDL